MRERPVKAGETTVARKWSPPPVQSSTSARASRRADSIRDLISSEVGIPDQSLARSERVAIISEAMSTTTVTYDAKGVSFTEKGAEKVREFLASQGADVQTAGLRVGVRGGGCSGFQYNLAFDTQRATDAVFEDHGLKLLVDRTSLQYVFGSQIDYVDSLQGAGFQVNNPNVVAACGCGSSFRVADEEQVSAV